MSGGVILGQTAIFLFHSLEILTGNTGLMNQLEIFIKDSRVLLERGGHLISPINNSDNINYIFVSLLMVEFTASSSLWLLPPGIFIGLETYKLVIKKWSKRTRRSSYFGGFGVHDGCHCCWVRSGSGTGAL